MGRVCLYVCVGDSAGFNDLIGQSSVGSSIHFIAIRYPFPQVRSKSMVFTCVIGDCDRTTRTLYKITASDIVQPVLPREPFYCCCSCVDRSIQEGLASGFWIQKVPFKKRPQQSKHEHQEAPPRKRPATLGHSGASEQHTGTPPWRK